MEASLGVADLSVVPVRALTPPRPTGVTYDAGTNNRHLHVLGRARERRLPCHALRAGRHGPTNAPMTADQVQTFFVLHGDINRDRAGNGSDFAILAGNFGKTGMTYARATSTATGA